MKVKNGLTYEKDGWKYISVKDEPKERGYAYGYLCAKDFKEIQKMLEFFMYESFGKKWEYFIEEINIEFHFNFPEYIPEVKINNQAHRNIFLTIKEALQNTIKHSQASIVKLNIEINNETNDRNSKKNNVIDGSDDSKINKMKSSLQYKYRIRVMKIVNRYVADIIIIIIHRDT